MLPSFAGLYGKRLSMSLVVLTILVIARSAGATMMTWRRR